MAYTAPQIGTILLKADRTMYKIGQIAYENMFAEDNEALDYERDIIFIYKKAVEYADDFFIGTEKLDKVVERLAAKISAYDYGELNPIYADAALLNISTVVAGAALNDLTDVTITNVQDNQFLRYNSVTGQWINVGPGSAVRNSQAFTATAGQTVFTTSFPFDAGLFDLYLNGVKLNSSSYTTMGEYQITLNDACLVGDIVDVVIFDPFTTIFPPVNSLNDLVDVSLGPLVNNQVLYYNSATGLWQNGTVSGGVWGSITGTLSNQTDLQTALDGKVPYTGATANVNLGEYEIKAGQVTLDTSPTGTAAVGTTRWNDTIGSSETTLKGGSVILKNGVDLVARVVNKVTPNTTLTKAAYQAVRVSGAQGQRLAVAFAQANNDNNSADTIGLVIETIATNQEGFIMTVGQIENINTTGSLQGETWVDGDVLYLSGTTAGALTNIKPTAPIHIVVIGYVEYAHANNGKIYVKVMNGWELDELHDVSITSVANNEALIYESATALWKNKSIATALGYTPEQPLTFNSPLSRSVNAVSIPQATGSVNGFLSSTDWATFNNKQNALGYTPANAATTLTINGVTYDLSTSRTFSVGTITGSGASGQVAYWDGTTSQAGSNNLFWDNTNGRLGVGLNNPADSLHLNTGGVRIQNIRASLDNFYTAGVVNGLKIQNTTTNGRTLLGLVPNGTSTLADFWVFNTSDTTTNYSALAWGYELNSTFWGINSISAGTGQTRPIYINATNGQAVASSNISFFTNGNVGIGTGSTNGGQRLQVQGTTLLNGNVTFSSSTGMFWDAANGRLGIGTNAPDNPVTVNLPMGANNGGLGFVVKKGTGYFLASNGTSAVNNFLPFFLGVPNYDAFGLTFQGNLFNTTSTNPALIFQSYNLAGSAAIQNSQITFAIANGATRLLNIYGNGNLLLQNGGTFTDSGERLQVTGSTKLNGNVTFSSPTGMFWDAANSRLGIGTDAPSYTFHVNGANAGIYLTRTSPDESFIVLSNTAFTSGAQIRGFSSGSGMRFTNQNSTTEWARFHVTSGNFGIGTGASDSGERLQVTGNVKVTGASSFGGILSVSVSSGFIAQSFKSQYTAVGYLGGDNTAAWVGTGADGLVNSILCGTSTNFIGFRVNSIERFRIHNSGNVSIGNTTDTYKLDVSGSIRCSSGGILFTTTSTGADAFYTLVSNNIRFYVSSNGYTKSTSSLISDVNGAGTINASAILQADSTTKGFLPPRGTNAQMLAIVTPATGLVFYDTTNNKLNCYDGTTWQPCW